MKSAFVAAAMVATSVGITARVLRDLNVLKFRASRIVLGAAVFDDMIGMVLLGIVVSIATGAGVRWLHLSLVIVEAVGFAVFMIFSDPGWCAAYGPGCNECKPTMPRWCWRWLFASDFPWWRRK